MTVKQKIPKALREQVWLKQIGNKFEAKCPISWCKNTITVFNYHCGHNNSESKGGSTTLDNLIPICSNCNLSMNNNYSIDDWNQIDKKIKINSKSDKVRDNYISSNKQKIIKKAKWYFCFLI